MCIGHGIRVTARAFVTFVKGRLKCLLLLLLLLLFTHSVLTAIFPSECGLAGCPLNSPSPFIPGLRILQIRTTNDKN